MTDENNFVKYFVESITPDILDTNNFINWSEINNKIKKLSSGINSLESLNKESKDNFRSDLKEVLAVNQASVLSVLKLLIGHSPDLLNLPDGRKLEFKKSQDAGYIANIFLDLGIFELLQSTNSIEDILKGVLIGLYPNTRKNIRGEVFEEKIKKMIQSVISEVKNELGQTIIFKEKVTIVLSNEKKNVDYAFFLIDETKPFAVLETNFYSTSGSKPSETVARAYPDLQNELNKIGILLIVISDGQGWFKMKNVLLSASQKLDYLFNFKQANGAALKSVLLSTIIKEGDS